ncbi:NAD(P)H-dependent oxidoreductase [Sphingobacterium spiritivorum]|uniref:NAD(P)H-dependent oxidoreductase n=1 Tax=Sphingobacterium spiritivorum TaxID=258 RepID=UPI003DA63D17
MSKNKILIINAHPNSSSFNAAIAETYKQGALEAGAQIQEIIISELRFDPNLQYGYRQRIELEPDLQQAWQKILWAEHIVWIHPVWWGGLPAISKGFIDRLFLPGRAFQYRPNSVFWDKLLKGRSAHIITTLDQPGWYYRLFFGRPSVNQLKRSVLQFCGISPVKVTYVGIVRTSSPALRQKWLQKVKRLGLHRK